MKLYTIGFTKTSAESFFDRLKVAGVKTMIDTRLRRDGQLSGFAKAIDLQFFLRELLGCTYRAEPLLAPTDEILSSFKKKELKWDAYAIRYKELLVGRNVLSNIDLSMLENACLLCSEHTADRCHRRLAAEFLRDSLEGRTAIEIVHL